MATQVEREALARILASGTFSRSPNLERMLVYLCNQYFSGQGAGLKEYHVATEALGRPETFDPKKDSIVRVEMLRLRRRLREYYDARPDEPISITIPEKSYVPEFLVNPRTPQIPAPGPSASVLGAPPVRLYLILAAVAGVLTSGFYFLRSQAPRTAEAVTTTASFTTVDPAPKGAQPQTSEARSSIRILAGRSPGRYIDRFGDAWEGDRYVTGGATRAVDKPVHTRGLDSNLFSGAREGGFRYDIPLRPGFYELELYFAETAFGDANEQGGGEASRVFRVVANGRPLLEDFDVLAASYEANTAIVRRFRDITPDQDGKLHLEFVASGSGQPFVNAIVLTPGTQGRIEPIRIVCRPKNYLDGNGARWLGDRYFRGGVQITRPSGAPAPNGDVFRGERYGNFSYTIPVPPGVYTVRLYFWEYWWGEGHPGQGGVRSRAFSVYANHRALLTDFNAIQADPVNQVAIKSFSGIEANPQGQITLDFVPKTNYAMVNAIEILDEGR